MATSTRRGKPGRCASRNGSCERCRLGHRLRPACREADLAIEFREDVAALPLAEVQRIVAIMQSLGLTEKASSIHVNGWFGGYDKLSTSRLMMREEFAIDLDVARDAFVFAGDSPNDQPMFEFFPHAVAVANVRDMEELMTHLPAWVTPSRGFAELAEALLSARWRARAGRSAGS